MVFVFGVTFMSLSGVVHAAPCEPKQDILGIPTWYKYLDSEQVGGKCRPIIRNPEEGAAKNLSYFLPIGLAVLEIMLTVGGLVAVVMVFWAAFKYVLTQGEPEKAAGARKTAINAVIGLVIIIISTRIVSFIAGRLG
jgi:hypothetical protein